MKKGTTASNPVAVDKDWMAEDDARTIARANEIMADPKRCKAAIKASEALVKEHKKTLMTMKSVKKARGGWASMGNKMKEKKDEY